MKDCYSCRQAARLDDAPIRERIYWNGLWRVAHAVGCSLPGWLVVLPARHLTSVAELSAEEAAALGPLLRAVSHSLVEVTGCVKTYVAMFAEQEGFEHVHFHVIPRMSDLAPDLRGAGVFAYLKKPPAEWVTEAEMDRIGRAVADRLG